MVYLGLETLKVKREIISCLTWGFGQQPPGS